MACLTDLPHELLQEIFLIASCGDQRRLRTAATVNKQIQKVVFPLLVRHWQCQDDRSEVGKLALHLLRHPQHRLLVRTLDFGLASDLHQVGTSPILLNLRPQTLAELAEAAEITSPDFSKSSNWGYLIRKGCADAIATLILAWATRVTEVDFALPKWTAYSKSDSMMVQFIDWAAQNIHTGRDKDLSLAEVQHLRITTWGTNHDSGIDLPSSVFQLPKLRILETYGMGIGNLANIPILASCSAIDKLSFDDSGVTGTRLCHAIGPCGHSRLLNYSLHDLGCFSVSKETISKTILRKAESLKELHLDLYGWHMSWFRDVQLVSNHEVPLDRCFKHLSQLEKLTVDVRDLLLGFENEIMPDFLVARLPVSLKELTINWNNKTFRFSEDLSLERGDHYIWLGIVEALKVLLQDAGSGHRELRYLYAMEILYGSDELRKVVEIGESNGVQVVEKIIFEFDENVP